MLPLVYKVNDIKQRLIEVEAERRRELAKILDSNETVCDHPNCTCHMWGLPCKLKR